MSSFQAGEEIHLPDINNCSLCNRHRGQESYEDGGTEHGWWYVGQVETFSVYQICDKAGAIQLQTGPLIFGSDKFEAEDSWYPPRTSTHPPSVLLEPSIMAKDLFSVHFSVPLVVSR